MDDKMRRIAPSDLSMLRNTSTEPTVTFSAAAAISPSSAAACPHCAGAGYYKEEVPYGHPNFGKLMPCICKQQENGPARGREAVRDQYFCPFNDKTFENFNPAVPGVQGAFYAAQKYADGGRAGWLFLATMAQAKPTWRLPLPTSCSTITTACCSRSCPTSRSPGRATFRAHPARSSTTERFEAIRDVQVLVLDDLGTENTTPWARQKLFQIVNHRYNHTLSTVFTSNRKPEDIDPRGVCACRIACCATSTS